MLMKQKTLQQKNNLKDKFQLLPPTMRISLNKRMFDKMGIKESPAPIKKKPKKVKESS